MIAVRRHRRTAVIVAAGFLSILATLAAIAVMVDGPSDASPPPPASDTPAQVSAGALYAASFRDLAGKQQTLGQWEDKLLVVNFWATWCAPCREEMPVFSRLQTRHGGNGLQIVGIAADSAANVAKFQSENPVSYALLPDDAGAITFSKRLGNRFGLLPHTVVFAPKGAQVFARLGVVTEAELEAIIDKHLPNPVKQ